MKKLLLLSTVALFAISNLAFAEGDGHGHEAEEKPHAVSEATHGAHVHAEDADVSETIVQVMQGMNENLAALSQAIMLENFSLISSSAYNIANHPSISQEDLHALFERLGDKKEVFIKCDIAVHDLAMSVSHAGKQEDMPLILDQYSAMLSKAVECHSKYRKNN